ncbi:hypothetical protein [Sphingomonas sp.]|uniref:hypothetical protein n=1 Tax=Sphingomonas sp. TaxID=28214 RepID=UPI0025ED88EC|nr:hypothetical protein [Sphingomonas sp.]
MSARGFGSVLSAGAVVGAALGFYLVSLRVASERAALEDVETRIAMTQRDIRLLQTEIGTRGRLAQLERWNVKFIRLSAPSADQFVQGGFQLATLVAPPRQPAIDAPVVLAAASIPPADGQPKLTGDADLPTTVTAPSRPANQMLHVASYSVPQPQAASAPPREPVAVKTPPATKPVKTATADPLAPLSGAGAKAKGSAPAASAGGASSKPQKARVTD